jgi:hypothetical protein
MRNGKWGYIDENGKEVVPCKYYTVSDFKKGWAWVSNGFCLYWLDSTFREIKDADYDRMKQGVPDESGEPALYIVNRFGKYGFINKNREEVVPCRYQEVSEFKEGLSRVKDGGKWGFIDKTGREVIPCRYDVAYDFDHGWATVHKGMMAVKVDKTGREMNALEFWYLKTGGSPEEESDVLPQQDKELLPIKKRGKWGFVDETGRIVVACQYDDVNSFSDGLAMVEKDGKWGFIDIKGREVILLGYESAFDFHEGIACVYNGIGGGMWGYIDKNGRELFPARYYSYSDFHEGLARVRKEKKWGYIDRNGDEVIPCMYDSAEDFHEGLARVRRQDQVCLIDKNGREVLPQA